MIGGLSGLQLESFRSSIDMRRKKANDFDRPHSMCYGKNLLLIDSLLTRPDSPLAVDRLRGVDQNSVEIKENGRAIEADHGGCCIHA